MKASFLPRPVRNIKPRPQGPGHVTPQEFRPSWNEPVAIEFEESDIPQYQTQYTPFPQAPDPNADLTQDLEPFYRTK